MPLNISKPTQTFKANGKGRDFVAGDLHGHFELLEKILGQVEFDTFTDRLFMTGDLVDRGPHSELVTEWLAKPWFHSVRGNHEQMIIDYWEGLGDRLRHSKNGGQWFYSCPINLQKKLWRNYLDCLLHWKSI